MNGLALFAGIGGLELGLRLAIPGYRTVCHVERDAYAAATLVARMEEAAMDPAPIWDDVTTFDGRPWHRRVSLVSGGFPCQDVSTSGTRRGIGGERSGLWAHFARIVGDVRPEFVFVENVSALAIRGIDRVLGDLARLGFNAEWDCYTARAAGAPHIRRRLFVLAERVPNTLSGFLRDESGRRHGAQGADCPPRLGPLGANVAHSRRVGLRNGERASRGNDAYRYDLRGSWPPGPGDADGWREWIAQGGPEPAIRRGVDGDAAGLEFRTDRLRCLGNGVVPQVAADAFLTLARRLEE